MLRVGRSVAAFLLVGVFAGVGIGQHRLSTGVVDDFVAQYPAVRTHQEGSNAVAMFGTAMSKGTTAERAVINWIEETRPTFAANGGELRIENDGQLGGQAGRRVYSVRQFVDGLPVDNGVARVLVQSGADHAVTYFGAKLAEKPAGGFHPVTLNAAASLAIAKNDPDHATFDVWTAPELVIYMDPDSGIAHRVWRFMGGTKSLVNHEARTFYVDAASGDVVASIDEVHHVDVTGTLVGLATPGTGPDSFFNPPVETPLPEMLVSTSVGEATFTDLDGNFSLSVDDSEVTVLSEPRGRWVQVVDQGGVDLELSQSVNAPADLNLLLNPTPAQFEIAQINGALHTTTTHNFLKDRQPDFDEIDRALRCNVNIDDFCNANFSSLFVSINFFRNQGGCRNSAYSSVIAHEYGHYVVYSLGLSQGAFGEGFSDVVANMQYDDPVIGRDFRGPGTRIRNTQTADRQYPCSGGSHFCGQLLAGVWWDIKSNIEATIGESEGLEYTRQLFTDWSRITIGGIGGNSAHPQTAVEVLTADDDDANICNGTPFFDEICSAFAAHNIACPELSALTFAYPQGLPEEVMPQEQLIVPVDIGTLDFDPVPGTGLLHYRFSGIGNFFTTPLVQSTEGPGSYEARLPLAFCGETLEYYFSAQIETGQRFSDPCNAPNERYSVFAAGITRALFDFEDATGWTVSGDAVAGQWEVGTPLGSGDAGDPTEDYDGSGQCFLTGNTGEGGDVDEGGTVLTSPVFDASGLDNPIVTYARWYSNNTGTHPQSDVMLVEISNDGGETWTTLEEIGPTGPVVFGGWQRSIRPIGNAVAQSEEMQVRFVVDDFAGDSNIEAAVDSFTVFSCSADVDGMSPAIVHRDSHPKSGYIDPRAESDNGVDQNLGVNRIAIKFSEPVKDVGLLEGGGLTIDSFSVVSQNTSEVEIVGVDDSQNPLIYLDLSGPIPVGVWTTIKADVEDFTGNRIDDLGDLGPDTNEPDRIDIGFLPGDVDQSGEVGPLDLFTFRTVIGTATTAGDQQALLELADIDRNGALQPMDLFRYRQLVQGVSPATQAWGGTTIGDRP